MVLASQKDRSRDRHFTPSGSAHRRGSRWPWGILLVGIALIAVGLGGWLSFRHEPLPQQAGAQADENQPPSLFTGRLAHATPLTGSLPTLTTHPPAGPMLPNIPGSPRTVPPTALASPVPPSSHLSTTPATMIAGPSAATMIAGPSAATMIAGPSAATQPGSTLTQGMALIADGKLVEGRAFLNQVLLGPETSAADAQMIRDTLASVNKILIFSQKVMPGDPLVEAYTVQPGDKLLKLANRYRIPENFLAMINKRPANKILWGQKLKMIKGPFEAVVSKSAFRMDLFLPGPDGVHVYICSFPVGLGESDSTPLGQWVIRPGGKVKNPDWTNPRTGEHYASGDPKNPIGQYWLALEGADDQTKGLPGYGIHGTIDPDSIGKQSSMGCIRLRDDDIAELYLLLFESISPVTVVP